MDNNSTNIDKNKVTNKRKTIDETKTIKTDQKKIKKDPKKKLEEKFHQLANIQYKLYFGDEEALKKEMKKKKSYLEEKFKENKEKIYSCYIAFLNKKIEHLAKIKKTIKEDDDDDDDILLFGMILWNEVEIYNKLYEKL